MGAYQPTTTDVSNFMNTFYGYGNLDAPYWFIGKEEGGGACRDEFIARIQTWLNRGSKQIDDLYDYHSDLLTALGTILKTSETHDCIQNQIDHISSLFLFPPFST
jgi:hypothetical protein